MAVQRKSGLGRGLGALLPTEPAESQSAAKQVSISDITPNPCQPRTEFAIEDLQELADSIKEHGVIQPLIVAESGSEKYTLIAGERRLRASQLAGLETVPVIIRQATDREMLEIALIENVQRADLSPLETAEAYRHLEETFGMTHEEISKRVGKNRVSVTNTLRLLKLSAAVQEALVNRKITEGHARVLLALPTEEAQAAALDAVIDRGMSVRQTEEYVRSLLGQQKEKKPVKGSMLTPELRSIEESLRQSIGTKVTIKPGKSGSGTIQIHYYSDEELENLLLRFGNSND